MRKPIAVVMSLIATLAFATGTATSALAEEVIDNELAVPSIRHYSYGPYGDTTLMTLRIVVDADKDDASITGYQASISTSHDFSNAYTPSTSKRWFNHDSAELTYNPAWSSPRLYSGYTYYFKVRAYKNDGDDADPSDASTYGNWSKTYKVNVPNYYQPRKSDAAYSYEIYALSDVDSVIYSDTTRPYFIKTDNPDPNTISIELDGGLCGSDGYYGDEYRDLPLNHKESVNDLLRKVDGGYIWFTNFPKTGNHTLTIKESDSSGYAVAEAFDISVHDYTEDMYAWIDSVIAATTTKSMDKFEKMQAICNYLLPRFKYIPVDKNERIAKMASIPSGPFFRTYRWDSLTSPNILCHFADRIGGFTTIDNLYYAFSKYDFTWDQAHWFVVCGDENRWEMYQACPLVDTGIVSTANKLDLTDSKNLYKIQGLTEGLAVTLPEYSFEYTGEPVIPEPFVKVGSKTLKKGTDYTVSYDRNDRVGLATITITGIGSYEGKSTSLSFRIREKRTSTTGSGTGGGTNNTTTDTITDNNTSHFDTSGTDEITQGGWFHNNGKWYYTQAGTGELKTGWFMESDGTWYHFDKNGVMERGWQKINKKWYHFTSSGRMHTGWTKIGKKWYFFHSKNGDMKTGWVKSGGKWYYMGGASDGAMKTGWVKSGKKWYFMNASGAMVKSCWIGNYYMQKDGSMAVNKWVDGGRYHVGPNGAWNG